MSSIKPGIQVSFINLSEPIMTVLSVSGNSAICEYQDEYLKKKIKLPCSVDTLQVVKVDETKQVKDERRNPESTAGEAKMILSDKAAE